MGQQEKMNATEYRKLRGELADRDKDQGRAKYGNVKTVVDGIEFHSCKEAKWYGNFKMLQRAGTIISFEMQKPFALFVNRKLITTYIADFVLLYPDGRFEVVDIKSKETAQIAVYRIKKTLMSAIHNITIVEK